MEKSLYLLPQLCYEPKTAPKLKSVYLKKRETLMTASMCMPTVTSFTVAEMWRHVCLVTDPWIEM